MTPQPVRFPKYRPIFQTVKPVPRDPKSSPRAMEAVPNNLSPLYEMMTEMNARLKERWKQHQGKHERVVLRFRLLQDGSISKLEVPKSSGNDSTDRDAELTVKEICLTLKQPANSDPDGMDIEINFSDKLFESNYDEKLIRNKNPKS